MVRIFRSFLLFVSTLTLSACEQPGLTFLKDLRQASLLVTSSNEGAEGERLVSDLNQLVVGSPIKVDVDAGFAGVMTQALDQDPVVIAAKNQADVQRSRLLSTESRRDTQITATALGGVEDLTDETIGVAAILTANRMLYDGGRLDAQIDADKFNVKAANQAYLAQRGQRALRLANAWIELERYQALSDLISDRLTILDPLLVQLESVASAGVADVSQVAAAQRVVSSILMEEAEVTEKYTQSTITFISGFGRLPAKSSYDESWVSKAVPALNTKKLVENSPDLLAKYWAYRSAEAAVVAIEAKENFNIGFKIKLQRPFGGSEANSDESVGFVLTKDLYQGEQLKSQVRGAEETARVKSAEVVAGYRESELILMASNAAIESMNKAIKLARNNAESSREEIEYLRKQLIIGRSTLESVLSAEARLYGALSKEIVFIAERRKAVATVAALTGHFSKALGSD